jgi:hypothetical protein
MCAANVALRRYCPRGEVSAQQQSIVVIVLFPGRGRDTARAGSRRLGGMLSAPRAHAEAPHKLDSRWEALRVRNRPGRARTVRAPKPAE